MWRLRPAVTKFPCNSPVLTSNPQRAGQLHSFPGLLWDEAGNYIIVLLTRGVEVDGTVTLRKRPEEVLKEITETVGLIKLNTMKTLQTLGLILEMLVNLRVDLHVNKG